MSRKIIQAASSIRLSSSSSSVALFALLRCRQTITGSASGSPPQGEGRRRARITTLRPQADTLWATALEVTASWK
jgi:hypothetical protein